MRYPEGHKDEVRKRIVGAASEALRSHGIEGVSIPQLMKRAGLTHGGFYTHFADREELVAEAVTAAAASTGEGVFGASNDLARVLELYLSPTHVEEPARGCVLAALGADAGRQPPPIRRAFTDAARGMLSLLEKKRPRPSTTPSDETLVRAALMIGAIVLGRLVQDPVLVDRILRATRKAAAG